MLGHRLDHNEHFIERAGLDVLNVEHVESKYGP
jgi:hypothetical protein